LSYTRGGMILADALDPILQVRTAILSGLSDQAPVPLDIRSLTFDCNDPAVMTEFWSRALGGAVVELDDEGGIVHLSRSGPRLLFLKVPEPKTAKNRLHLDLRGGDMAAEVHRLVQLGAAVVCEFRKPGDVFTVMTDPEGNEFCVEEPRA
jgi:predicted enzyme related to lactoylglutathione lyase